MNYNTQKQHRQQMDDIFTSPIIPFCLQEIDTNDIMKSIEHTNELIKRTKVYVQNIPLKSNMTSHRHSLFQQLYHSESPQKWRKNDYSKIESQYQKSNDQCVTFDLPLNSFHKSPTPVGKFIDLEQEYETRETDSPIKMMTKDQGLFPFQSLEKDSQKKQLSSHNKQFEIQTFRPTTINIDKKMSQKIIKKPLQITIDKQSQPKSTKNTPKATKSPLNKTFDLYPTYSSSIPTSTKSGRKINQSKPFQFGENDKKVSAQEIINYFKKKQQNEDFYKGQNVTKEQLFKQKRFQRQKVIQEAIKSSMRDSVQKISVSRGSSSKKTTPTKKLFNNKPINPFESIQEEYEQKKQKKINKIVKSPIKSPIKKYNNLKKPSPTKYTGFIKRKQSIKKQQIVQDEGTVKKVTSRPIKIKQQKPADNSHDKVEISISTYKPQINIVHQQQTQNDRKQKSHRRKHGITVLLSTPQKMKVSQIQYRSSLQPSLQKVQNEQRKRSSSTKKHYLQISIKSNNSLEKLQRKKQLKQSKVFQTKPNLQKKSFAKKQPISATNINTVKKHQNRQKQSTITQKIYAQLDKIQALNRTGNRINLKNNDSEENQNDQQKHDEKLQQKLSKRIQKHYQHQLQSQDDNLKHYQIQTQRRAKMHKEKQDEQNKNDTTQRFRINQINSITIYPSSLEKYKSSSQYMSHNSSYAQLMNNTFAFTPEKRQRFDTEVPLNHIIRLERSMEALDKSSVEKSLEKSKRKRIFNTDKKSELNLMKGFKNSQRVKNIFEKEVSNHNKSLQSKLYNFLVQEDAQGKKKQSVRKSNLSPPKMRRSSSKQAWKKIFDTEKRSKVNASPKQKSPRSPKRSSFKYKPLNEFQNNLLHRSFESFQDTLRCESIGKNSVESNKKSTKQNQPGYKTKHRLQQQQIRKQIKKIKQYDFIQRYMSNYELQRLMRKYIHENIHTRKWSLMVIDQVYNRIREKKEQQQK